MTQKKPPPSEDQEADLEALEVIEDVAEAVALEAEMESKAVEEKRRNDHVDRFISTFERSARRWEMVVYPAMFAFILLAGYGFFLIYSLTNDMRSIARSFDPHMGSHMESFSESLDQLTLSIAAMTNDVQTMTNEIQSMSIQMNYLAAMDPMQQRMSQMVYSVDTMAMNLDLLRRDMAVLNYNVSRPMSVMNKFIP